MTENAQSSSAIQVASKIKPINYRPGAPRKIKDADELWAIFEEYQKYMATRFWHRQEVLKGGERAGQIVDVKIQYPWSVESFCLFAGISRQSTWDTYFTTRAGDSLDKVAEFRETACTISDAITEQQLAGGEMGAYSSSIVAARVGLLRKVQLSGTGEDGAIKLEQIIGMEVR